MSSLINFSGIASGIDSASLIKAMLDNERKSRIEPLQTKITTLTDTSTSLNKLSDLLDTLKDAASKFRTINGGALSKIANSSDETKITASASNGATNATYAVTVSQLARSGTLSLNDRFASTSTAINSSINDGSSDASRTVSISIGTGDSQSQVDVVLTSSTTAEQFVTSFNQATSEAQASLVNVGTTSSPSYAIVINSSSEGTESGTIALNVGSEITSAGGGAFLSSTLTQAQDAEFSVSGISGTITRSTNSINDVISNVTIGLKSTGSSTLTVTDDPAQTTQTIQDFVTAFNDVVSYIKENDQVSRSEEGAEVSNIFGPLAQTSIDENVLSSLRNALRSSSLSGGTINTLADLGITTQRDGSLALDTEKLEDALSSDPSRVGSITTALGDSLASVDGVIPQFTRFNGLIDNEVNSETSSITSLNSRIADIENALAKRQEALNAQFARLESLMGRLNSQQSSLDGLL